MNNITTDLVIKTAIITAVAFATVLVLAYFVASVFGEQTPILLHSVDTAEKLGSSYTF